MRFSFCLIAALVASTAVAQVTHPYSGMTLVRSGGSAMVVSDLCAAGVSVRATRFSERNARPQQWADGLGVQAAINADFFDFPGWSRVVGRARGAGEEWPADRQNSENRAYWQFGPGLAQLVGDANIAPASGVTEIVSGHNVLIQGGQSRAPNFDGDSVITTAHRRTAIGVSADRRFLYLYATDNNFTGSQVVAQLEQMRVQAGAPPIDMATNEDGGGSSQLYVRGIGEVIDSTRPVNNHLGVFARGSGDAPNCPIPPDKRDVALRGDGKSGWTMDVRGRIEAFGGAPALGPPGARWSFDVARRLVLRKDGTSAYLLDGWGGIHEVGNAPAATGYAYWPNWDIARAIVLRADQTSDYTLDGYGGIHPFGGAPVVGGGPYWPDFDIARDLLLRDDGISGYVLDGLGVLHPFGGAPALAVPHTFTTDIAVRAVLSFDQTSGYVVDKTGALWPFGNAPTVKSETFGDNQITSVGLGPDAVSGVVLHPKAGPKPWRSARVMRAFGFKPGTSQGYRLRGDGSLAAFGGAPDLMTPILWPDWDIARDLVLRPDGVSGWIVDGYGGVHAFGGATQPPAGGPYWPSWDIVRRIVPGPNGTLGYLMEGYGGIHALAGTPDISYTGYWAGSDMGRDFAINAAGTGGFSLDGYGALFPFGVAPGPAEPALWTWDIGRALALRADQKSGYLLDGWGGVHPFGHAPAALDNAYAPGWDVYRDIAVQSDTEAFSLDVYGTVHPIHLPYVDAGVDPMPGGDQTGVDGGAGGGSGLAPSDTLEGADTLKGGCGCSGASGSLPALVLALALRRRRSTTPPRCGA